MYLLIIDTLRGDPTTEPPIRTITFINEASTS
jgi:hypothetical protein